MTNTDTNDAADVEKLRREMIEMANRAADEIETLRARIGVLEPKADAYDRMAQMLDMMPQKTRGYGVDVAWMLRKRVKELEAARHG